MEGFNFCYNWRKGRGTLVISPHLCIHLLRIPVTLLGFSKLGLVAGQFSVILPTVWLFWKT